MTWVRVSLPNPCNTIPVSTVSQVCTGILVPNIRSGEWSYDLVDSLTTLLDYTIQTTTTIAPPTAAVSNCSRATKPGMTTKRSRHDRKNDNDNKNNDSENDNDNKNDNNAHHTDNHRHEQLLAGWVGQDRMAG